MLLLKAQTNLFSSREKGLRTPKFCLGMGGEASSCCWAVSVSVRKLDI